MINLEAFIVKAKAATYVGSGVKSSSTRQGSHDLRFSEGEFSYLDSYFGGTDFIGEEVVYYRGEPVWAMNYYGRIMFPELINGVEAGQIIKESLSVMYLRAASWVDSAISLVRVGMKTPIRGISGHSLGWNGSARGKRVYELDYHGGLIKHRPELQAVLFVYKIASYWYKKQSIIDRMIMR